MDSTGAGPLETALEQGILKYLDESTRRWGEGGPVPSLAGCIAAFSGAFPDGEIREAVRRLIAQGDVAIEARIDESSRQVRVQVLMRRRKRTDPPDESH